MIRNCRKCMTILTCSCLVQYHYKCHNSNNNNCGRCWYRNRVIHASSNKFWAPNSAVTINYSTINFMAVALEMAIPKPATTVIIIVFLFIWSILEVESLLVWLGYSRSICFIGPTHEYVHTKHRLSTGWRRSTVFWFGSYFVFILSLAIEKS